MSNNIELAVLDFLQTLHNPVCDALMTGITYLGSMGIVWLVLAAVLLARGKTRRCGISVLLALALSLLVCNLTIKPFVARVRPYELNTAVSLIVAKPTDYSFPSGHSSASFAAASALYFSRWRYWKYAAALAVLIAFSRLYLYVHFPTDVLAGSMLGILLGGAAVFALNLAEKKKLFKRV